ncbi:hypothetical protein SAGEFAYGE_6 [Bacillus phage SageFayge]|uniref:Uncharacterized protein n=1 Tax=Bacillus phage SageFayge TaxID=1805954 RepID=A0A143FL37_9CAUD|nr:hypothetical protein SAGEFAYGE_6 [Bacillus phage SageFayge]AMW62927.1 hypothetical protein SAGEFAYGE_6 [Bacillus phage SageFayge]
MGIILIILGIGLLVLWYIVNDEVSKAQKIKDQIGYNPSTFDEMMNFILAMLTIILTILYGVCTICYVMGVI